MKWKAKVTKADFEANVTRKRQVFALRPTYVNGFVYWFRFYEILEYNKVDLVTVIVDGKKLTFKVSNWIEISRQ